MQNHPVQLFSARRIPGGVEQNQRPESLRAVEYDFSLFGKSGRFDPAQNQGPAVGGNAVRDRVKFLVAARSLPEIRQSGAGPAAHAGRVVGEAPVRDLLERKDEAVGRRNPGEVLQQRIRFALRHRPHIPPLCPRVVHKICEQRRGGRIAVQPLEQFDLRNGHAPLPDPETGDQHAGAVRIVRETGSEQIDRKRIKQRAADDAAVSIQPGLKVPGAQTRKYRMVRIGKLHDRRCRFGPLLRLLHRIAGQNPVQIRAGRQVQQQQLAALLHESGQLPAGGGQRRGGFRIGRRNDQRFKVPGLRKRPEFGQFQRPEPPAAVVPLGHAAFGADFRAGTAAEERE